MTKDHIEEAISTERALDLALEALEQGIDGQTSIQMDKAITAIKQARSAPAQEPVALEIIRKWPEGFQERLQHVWLDVVSFIPNVKLYDLQRVLAEFGFTMKLYEGEAPAQPAPVQEPVAWGMPGKDGFIFDVICPEEHAREEGGYTVPLYTTPPGGRQSEDCLTAAQEDIQRLSALVRAQQITIDKLEQGEPVTERNVT